MTSGVSSVKMATTLKHVRGKS